MLLRRHKQAKISEVINKEEKKTTRGRKKSTKSTNKYVI